MRFNYIITIHNKQDLIVRVLTSVLMCAGTNSHIYLVLDGCSDNTESIIDEFLDEITGFAVTKLYAPDVHEIKSINIALKQIPQDEDGFNIILQDDVILGDRNFENKIIEVSKKFNNRIGMLSFRHGVNIVLNDSIGEINEVSLIESIYGPANTAQPLLPGEVAVRMVSVRSPECIPSKVVREVGYLDESYAPFCYDNHDYSLRCLQQNYVNVVFALKVHSEVAWGGMRNEPQPNIASIMARNRRRCYLDHAEFVRSLDLVDFNQAPKAIVSSWPTESKESAIRRYQQSRERMLKYMKSKQTRNIMGWLKNKISI